MTGGLAEGAAEALARCFLFEGLDPALLARLAAHARPSAARKGQDVFAAGDAVDGLRVVRTGLLRIWVNDPDGRELTLNLLGPGDCLGEIALLDGLPRTASATALEAADMVLLPRAPVLALLDAEPEAARHMLTLLCGRLRRAGDALTAMAFLDLRRRTLRLLDELAVRHAADADDGDAVFDGRFSQSDLGAMLGATREAVNKTLSALEADGAVAREAGRLRLRASWRGTS